MGLRDDHNQFGKSNENVSLIGIGGSSYLAIMKKLITY